MNGGFCTLNAFTVESNVYLLESLDVQFVLNSPEHVNTVVSVVYIYPLF